MKADLTLEELAQSVRDWCAGHNVVPANGQAADEITERTIRYYRTLGLLDPPHGNYAKTFSDKHRLQLIAIRLYQARGLPLRKIRDELYGQSLEALQALEREAARAGKNPVPPALLFSPPLAGESWAVLPLTGEFLLVSRQNRPVPRDIIEKINALLGTIRPQDKTKVEPCRN